MANVFQFVSGYVGMECLRILKNSMEIARVFNTAQNKDFKEPFAIGDTTLVKLPQRFLIRDGMQFTDQGIRRKSVPVTIQQPFGIDFAWDSFEQAIKAERSEAEIREQYLKPAMTQLAQEIDSRAALFAYQNTNNIVGALGTTPSTMRTYSTARTILRENACPWEGADRVMVGSPAMFEAAVAANASVFNPPPEIAKEFRSGEVGTYAGSTWVESMSLYSHTAGTWAGSVTLNGAPANGATSIAITATAGDTFAVGDVIAIDYSLATQINNANPSTRRSTGRAKFFVVTQALTALGSGNAADVLQIYPAIEGPGSQYQNVSAMPSSGQALTLFPGTGTPSGKSGINGLNFTKDAFALVSAPLEMPSAVEPISFMKRDPQTGIAIRFVRAWDQQQSRMTNRFDVVIGFGALYADNCSVRVLSLQ